MKKQDRFHFCFPPLSFKGSGNPIAAFLFSVLLGLSAVPYAHSESYARYCNPRFGFCVDYPTFLTRKPAPDNNDGISLHDRNGCKMSVSGINNVLDDTVESLMQSESANMDRVTYKSRGSGWLVLSGWKGTRVRYVKIYVGQGSLNTLFIEYPADRKSKYDPIVERVSHSFQPGHLGDSH